MNLKKIEEKIHPKRVQFLLFHFFLFDKGDPPKKKYWKKYVQLFQIKMFTLSTFHSPKKNYTHRIFFCRFQTKTNKNNQKIAVKRGKMRILKDDLHYFSSWSNIYLNSKFQAAMMFDGWGYREETHHFWICVWKNNRKKAPKKLNFSEKRICIFFGIKQFLCQNFMVLGVKMTEIFEKKNTKKWPWDFWWLW